MSFKCSFLAPLKQVFCRISTLCKIIVTKIAPGHGEEHAHTQGWPEKGCPMTSYCCKDLKTQGFGA